jgi:M6 family metalloprotease-like protein
MKKQQYILLRLASVSFVFILLLSNSNSKCQQANIIYNGANLFCGVDNESGISEPYFPHNGDTLKVLVVFCNFPSPSGNFEIPGSSICDYWPASQAQNKPSWADSIICPTTTNIWNRSLTGLFRDASLGNFFLVGNVYPHLYIFQHPVIYYDPDSIEIGSAVKELLQNIDDSVNYADYDRFDPEDFDSDNNLREPDGVVDFIFINFRFTNSDQIDNYGYSGVNRLGGLDGKFGSGVTQITLDSTIIKAGFPGSGCIYEMNTPWDLGIPAHEFGHHYTYGGSHTEKMGVYNLNGGGLASAFDREFLGWDTSSAMTSTTNTSFTLRDYFTTGDYIKIPRNYDTLYVENRGRKSYYASNEFRKWKWLATDPKYPVMADSGLLIYLKSGLFQFNVPSAFGRWDWSRCPTNNKYRVEFYSGSYNFFQKKSLNRFSGESTFYLENKPSLSFECEPITDVTFVDYMGVNGDSNTCFDVGYNEVYSPWSNPPIPIYNSSDSLTIEITGRNSNGAITVNVYYTNILGASPSKPQGLTVEKYSSGAGFNPKLNWNKNLEPDLASYNVYRGYVSSPGTEPSSYDSIANTSDSTFIDESIFLYGTGSPPCYTLASYAYKITSVDDSYKKSVKSDKSAITGYAGNCDPEGDSFLQTNNENINSYKLYDNYPNPFNPTTTITFDLQKTSLVKLKIYDITGREIQTLINDNRQKGRYSILFNAFNLASGIYYYKLQAGNFVSI